MTKLDSDVDRYTSIHLFHQNTCRTCAKVRLRDMDIAGIDLSDQICIWHVLRVGSDVHGYH